MKINTELLTDYLNEQCNEETKKEVENWIRSDIRNKNYFEELAFYWNTKISDSKQIEVDVRKGLLSIQKKRTAKKQLRIKKLLRYAAVVTLLIATSVSSYIMVSPNFNRVLIENQILSEKLVKLPDGSNILLAQGGTISYSKNFDGKERLVDLSGEAFFDIAKDKSRPFIITTKQTKTKVIGTSFRITENDLYTDITVQSGVVEFMESLNINNKVRLVKGESARFFGKNNVLLSKTERTSNDKFQIKHLAYKNQNLGSICKDLNELFSTNIKLGSNQIKELSITTTFENQGLENILQSISFSLDLEIEKKNDHILLK